MMRILISGLASIIAWTSYYFVSNDTIVADDSVANVLEVFATVLSGVTLILLLGWLVLQFIFGNIFNRNATGLSKVLVYCILSFVVSALVLKLLGFDIGAALATSAVLGAIVGLAMQPTLGSLVSGLAIQMDKILNVGDSIRFRDELVQIVALNWRHAVARTDSNMLMIIPNAILSNEALTIYPEDRSTLFECKIPVPITVPPQLVSNILSEAIADMEHLDSTSPVMVAPVDFQPVYGITEYRIKCYARFYNDIDELIGEILRRSWYALNRNDIHMPMSSYVTQNPHTVRFTGRDLLPELVSLLDTHFPGLTERLKQDDPDLQHVRPLLYAPNERIVTPAHTSEHYLLLLRGKVRLGEETYTNVLEYGVSAVPHLSKMVVQRLPRSAYMRNIVDWLAEAIGPYAERLARETAAKAGSLDQLVELLAAEIDNDEDREKFITKVHLRPIDKLRPGVILPLQTDISGRIMTVPPLVSDTETLFIAVSPQCLSALDDIPKVHSAMQTGQPAAKQA